MIATMATIKGFACGTNKDTIVATPEAIPNQTEKRTRAGFGFFLGSTGFGSSVFGSSFGDSGMFGWGLGIGSGLGTGLGTGLSKG